MNYEKITTLERLSEKITHGRQVAYNTQRNQSLMGRKSKLF